MAGDGEDGLTLRPSTGESVAAGRVTGHPTLKACPSKRKAKGALVSGSMSKKKADEDHVAAGSSEATEQVFAEFSHIKAGTKVMMLMSQEDIDSILNHKARGDSFKEFQARVAKEVEETGEFVVSEEHLKSVLEARAWMRKELAISSSQCLQYPHLVWED